VEINAFSHKNATRKNIQKNQGTCRIQAVNPDELKFKDVILSPNPN